MNHILIVDDEPLVRSTLSMFLRGSGFDVSEACDGNEALKLIERRPADLIILDLIMPGKEGLETLMALRKDGVKSKVIAVSGGAKSVNTDFLPLAEKLGADKTMKKPFRNEDLLRAIQSLL